MNIMTFEPFPGRVPVEGGPLPVKDRWLYDYRPYDTFGLDHMGAPVPCRAMGEIEARSEWKPGIRFSCLVDAFRVAIHLRKILTHKVEFGGSGQYPSLTGGPEESIVVRRETRWLALWLGHVDDWERGRQPEISIADLLKHMKRWPLDPISVFSNGYPEDNNYTLDPEFYWELDNGERTGAVYAVFQFRVGWRYSWQERSDPNRPNSPYVTRWENISLTTEQTASWRADLKGPVNDMSRTINAAGADFTLSLYAGVMKSSGNPGGSAISIPGEIAGCIDFE